MGLLPVCGAQSVWYPCPFALVSYGICTHMTALGYHAIVVRHWCSAVSGLCGSSAVSCGIWVVRYRAVSGSCGIWVVRYHAVSGSCGIVRYLHTPTGPGPRPTGPGPGDYHSTPLFTGPGPGDYNITPYIPVLVLVIIISHPYIPVLVPSWWSSYHIYMQ